MRPAFYAHSILTRFLRAPQGVTHAASVPVVGTAPGRIVAAAITGTPALGRADFRAVLIINEGTAAANVTLSMRESGGSSFLRFFFDPANVPDDNQPVGPSGTLPGPVDRLSESLPPRAFALWATPWEAPA